MNKKKKGKMFQYSKTPLNKKEKKQRGNIQNSIKIQTKLALNPLLKEDKQYCVQQVSKSIDMMKNKREELLKLQNTNHQNPKIKMGLNRERVTEKEATTKSTKDPKKQNL